MEHIIEPTQKAIDILMHPENRPNVYHVFIYGTLKQGCYNHHNMRGAAFVKKHRVTGYKIRTSGGIPFIEHTNDINDVTNGEIFVITQGLKDKLDIFERGYAFTEIEKGIYCYVPTFDVSDIEEIPINHEGYYEWTPRMELEYESSAEQRKLKARRHYEQQH